MPIVVSNPSGTLKPVFSGGGVLCTATATFPDVGANIQWTARVNGNPPNLFAVGEKAIYITPSSVSRVDANGNKTFNSIEIIATQVTSTSIVILQVQGAPFLNHTNVLGTVTDTVATPGTTPEDRRPSDGLMDGSGPPGPGGGSNPPVDQSNEGPSGGACVTLLPAAVESAGSAGCGCANPSTIDGGYMTLPDGVKGQIHTPGGGNGSQVNTPGGGNAGGILQGAPMWCASSHYANGSQSWVRPYGLLQFKSGCAALVTRGKTVELCTWFSNVPDPLVAAERIAGNVPLAAIWWVQPG
jgi:hypothetical protein